jgi:hypothetical protein
LVLARWSRVCGLGSIAIALQREVDAPNCEEEEQGSRIHRRGRAEEREGRDQDQCECGEDKGGHAPCGQDFMRFELHDLGLAVWLCY